MPDTSGGAALGAGGTSGALPHPNNMEALARNSNLSFIHKVYRSGSRARRNFKHFTGCPDAVLFPAQRRVAALHLFGRYIFEMAAQKPFVSEWIAHRARALAVELILERPDHGRAGLQRLLEGEIDVLDMQMHGEGGSTQGARPGNATLGIFV